MLPRVALLLTLALLPLGIIAVAQTQRAVDSARDTYRASLSAQTARLAQPEREAIQNAQGITQGLADALVVMRPTDAVCTDLMRYSSSRNDQIVFLGFIDKDLRSQCNNFGQSYDFAGLDSLQAAMRRSSFTVSYNPSGGASGKPVVIVQQPVFNEQGIFKGFVSLSVLTEDLVAQRRADRMAENAVLVTFNDSGQILTSDRPGDSVDAFLPAGTQLADLVGGGTQLFTERTRGGGTREFAVVPIVEGYAYALGSWDPARPQTRERAFATLTLLFPLLMWLISLVVALVAIRLQVIRPVRILGRQMRDFAEGRRVFHNEVLESAPTELREIGETFATMAQKVIRDEADLENTVHERDVLIKEVHHRVKNNLQLMSSILSMQARTAPTQYTRSALRKVQDRLASLAAVHRGLYETPLVSQVRVDVLLDDLLRQLTALGGDAAVPLDGDFDLQPVVLVPDQAGPFAMLAAEGFTNALKYGSAGPDGRRIIWVRLHPDPDAPDMIIFEIANTVGVKQQDEAEQGLGLKLIQAFCAQLDGRLVNNEEKDGWYIMRIRFKVQEFEPDQHTPRV
ncbi:MAG TPA: histidine kinase dimerization/phosphoacceptor domain -containing protein [Roseovarius sp.]